jgi:hypothetical protein
MTKTLYFARADNNIAFSYDIIQAHYLMTSQEIKFDDHEAIRNAAASMSGILRELERPSVKFLVKHGHTVPAIRVYHELNNCTLHEARDAVQQIVESLQREES